MAIIEDVKTELRCNITEAEFYRALELHAEEYAKAGVDPDKVLAGWKRERDQLTEFPLKALGIDSEMLRKNIWLYFNPQDAFPEAKTNEEPDLPANNQPTQPPSDSLIPFTANPNSGQEPFPISTISNIPETDFGRMSIIKTIDELLGGRSHKTGTLSSLTQANSGDYPQNSTKQSTEYAAVSLEVALALALVISGYASRNKLSSAYRTIRDKINASQERLGKIVRGFIDDKFTENPEAAFVDRITMNYKTNHKPNDIASKDFKNYVQLFLRKAQSRRNYSFPLARQIVGLVMEYADLPGKKMEELKNANQEAIRAFVYSLPESKRPIL